jgi:CO/xanthine dehydrogenase Mo-binding subunit
METGTGSHTMIRRVVAEGLALPLEYVVIRYVDTAHLPYDSGGGDSRVTISASEVAHLGNLEFHEDCIERWPWPWASQCPR